MNFFQYAVPILAQIEATASGDTVTVEFNVSQVVTAIIVGLIAGALASLLVRGRRFSLMGSIALGALGAVVGGFIFSALNIQIDSDSVLASSITIHLIDILVAFIGALIILAVYYVVFRRRLR